MTKYTTAVLMAIMLLAQIGIAQHNVVHFTDHGHYEHGQDDDHGDHKKNASESCQICLLTKSLSLGLVASHTDIPIHAFSGHDSLKNIDQIVVDHQKSLYNPRAPPTFFI